MGERVEMTTRDGFTAIGDRPCNFFVQARHFAEDVCQCGYYKSDHGKRSTPRTGATRFRISTHDNGYYCVSIPNYDGGEVVVAEDYDALAALASRLIGSLRFLRDTAFALHLNDRHKPDAFAACEHYVCQRACQVWNETVEQIRDSQEG